ncbi:hypothetical protein J6X15_03215 [Candidatus Saccharibacteria bacterium]|nr:hypothetical protein [Candidatus Saccharibacteria bacterium]
MKFHANDYFCFTALDDFANTTDKTRKLEDAKEFGIRIIECRGLTKRDWRVIKGPFWRFRRRASSLLLGHDDEDDFFIRKVEATIGSSIRLYYHDLQTGEDAIIEIRRKPGLCLTFRSGRKPNLRADVISRCTHGRVLRFISFTEIYDIV